MTDDLVCNCGACGFELNISIPTLSLLCACEDCLQALQWGASKGGNSPMALPELIYVRSDILAVTGKKFMKAFHLREGAKSTRVYCTLCFSVLGVDHPSYRNNVFMFFKNHCQTHFNVSQQPAAAIYLNELTDFSKAKVPLGVPVFHSFHFPQEQARFRKIVSPTFKQSQVGAVGQSLQDVIKTLGPVKVLNLTKGKQLL